ncbi:UNVERIFIED_CONTAM: Peroxidase 64 [Sesamum radiatum]|uniref:peroxidase n=1 Tax=Sesamum radiatum TaxID=300843 RepID=A0AAW2SHC9_SESRA
MISFKYPLGHVQPSLSVHANTMAAIFLSLVTIFLVYSSQLSSTNALSVNYYHQTCPTAESIVANVVHEATTNDKTVPAALLRTHFHDCFIRGCDASVLLNSKGKNKAEKDGPPNISLHALYVIDQAKKQLEKKCPGVVSCADILALAARDAVVLSGGPTWDVPKGRKDGRISKAIDTRKLPLPTFNISQLEQSFSQRGLSLDDLVALSEQNPQLQQSYRRRPIDGGIVCKQAKAGSAHSSRTKALIKNLQALKRSSLGICELYDQDEQHFWLELD